VALVPCNKDVISSVLSGTQGDCEVTSEGMASSKDRYRNGGEMPCFFSCY
jgi:hypothetical protein